MSETLMLQQWLIAVEAPLQVLHVFHRDRNVQDFELATAAAGPNSQHH